MSLYLSRLRLSRSPSAAALSSLLNPRDEGPRLDVYHKLLWSVFTDGPDRTRDFLWRDEGEGRFVSLSARPPMASALFDHPEVKDFAPVLSPGDRLAFALRANATRTRKLAKAVQEAGTDWNGATDAIKKGKESVRVDVVMDALLATKGQTSLPDEQRSERPFKRSELMQTAGTNWLAGQGAKAGFRLIQCDVGDYSAVALPGYRGRRQGQPQFGILDMSGVLEITDPAAFLPQLVKGFGRAKAFGCGLMLIRRVG